MPWFSVQYWLQHSGITSRSWNVVGSKNCSNHRFVCVTVKRSLWFFLIALNGGRQPGFKIYDRTNWFSTEVRCADLVNVTGNWPRATSAIYAFWSLLFNYDGFSTLHVHPTHQKDMNSSFEKKIEELVLYRDNTQVSIIEKQASSVWISRYDFKS